MQQSASRMMPTRYAAPVSGDPDRCASAGTVRQKSAWCDADGQTCNVLQAGYRCEGMNSSRGLHSVMARTAASHRTRMRSGATIPNP